MCFDAVADTIYDYCNLNLIIYFERHDFCTFSFIVPTVWTFPLLGGTLSSPACFFRTYHLDFSAFGRYASDSYLLPAYLPFVLFCFWEVRFPFLLSSSVPTIWTFLLLVGTLPTLSCSSRTSQTDFSTYGRYTPGSNSLPAYLPFGLFRIREVRFRLFPAPRVPPKRTFPHTGGTLPVLTPSLRTYRFDFPANGRYASDSYISFLRK